MIRRGRITSGRLQAPALASRRGGVTLLLIPPEFMSFGFYQRFSQGHTCQLFCGFNTTSPMQFGRNDIHDSFREMNDALRISTSQRSELSVVVIVAVIVAVIDLTRHTTMYGVVMNSLNAPGLLHLIRVCWQREFVRARIQMF